jgi:hypothetical protein
MKMAAKQSASEENCGFEVLGEINFKKGKIVEKVTTVESLNGCLFSDTKSTTFQENLDFMFKTYGFFILEEKSCIDKEGLVRFLAKKIHEEKSCIYCCKNQTPLFSSTNFLTSC